MRGNEGKLELSAGGVVMLAVATLVATAIVFLLGIYVGKGITEERLATEQRVVRLPVPGQTDGTKSGEVEVTFWDRLSEEEPGREPLAAKPAVEATATELPVRVAPPGAAEPAAPAAEAPAARGTQAAGAAATPVPAAKPAVADVKPPGDPALVGTYLVQVQALADRAGADRITNDLRAKGYAAQISPAKRGAQTLYRVRVGTFATEDAARTAIDRLKREGYPGAFLAAGAD